MQSSTTLQSLSSNEEKMQKHTCQLSRIIRESPGYGGADLLVSRTGHQIFRIKSSFDLFCALVWDVAHFFLKWRSLI